MRTWLGVVCGAVLALAACSHDRGATKTSPVEATAEPNLGQARYVDTSLGFEVLRPTDRWQIDVSGELSADGIASPVVLRNKDTGAQVVIQVAPAVGSPTQLAERLTRGMRSHPGFVTSDPEPVALSDDAVGFRFAMGDKVHGRVAVREGAPGRVLMMLATWPADASDAAASGVEDVFRSVHPVDVAE